MRTAISSLDTVAAASTPRIEHRNTLGIPDQALQCAAMSDAAHAPADPVRLAEIELDQSVTMAAAAAQALAAAKEAHEQGRGSADEENLRQALIHAIMRNAAAAMRVRRLRLILHEARLDCGLPVENRRLAVPAATAAPAHRASDEVEPSQDDDGDDDPPTPPHFH